MSNAAFVLWWMALVITVVLVLPIVLYLLNRTFRSANDIRIYTAEILAAAQGLAHNLDGVKELDRTPTLALRVREAASALVAEAADLERAVGERS